MNSGPASIRMLVTRLKTPVDRKAVRQAPIAKRTSDGEPVLALDMKRRRCARTVFLQARKAGAVEYETLPVDDCPDHRHNSYQKLPVLARRFIVTSPRLWFRCPRRFTRR